MKRILHISPAEKFLPSFIEFLSKYFGLKEHKFLIVGDLNKFGIETSDDIVWPKKNLFGLFQIIKGMNTAEKNHFAWII